jgi:hypothetical protein
MRHNRLKLKHLLYAAAFLLALTIRMAGIGRPLLSDAEAALALQALAIANGQEVLLLPHPLYLVLTAPLMFLFQAADWTARFWPLIAGSLLVLTPALFHRWIGALPAVVLAFFLALDPGLTAVSLQAGSLPLALLLVISALGFWLNGRTALAGIAAGLALLSGPQVWPGIIALGLSVFLLSRLARTPPAVQAGIVRPVTGPLSLASSRTDWRKALLFALGALFFAGTLFFIIPRGLSAMAASLPAYLQGWVQPSAVPITLLLLALLFYEFFPLLFGLFGAVNGTLQKFPADRFLFIWFGVSLVLVLLYPGREVSHLLWVILPLSALAARQVARILQVPAYDRLAALGQMLLAAVILGFISLTLISMANVNAATPREYAFRLTGSIVMLVASTLLIAWGWSRPVAARGFSWGLALILFLFTVASTWNAAGIAGRSGGELWTAGRNLPEARLMLRTIGQLNQWTDPRDGGRELVVVGVDSPALRWVLKDVRNVRFTNFLSAQADPAMAVTVDNPTMALSATYRGQGFVLQENTRWNQITPLEWVRWMVFRAVPSGAVQREQIILWVRSDVFPGGELVELPILDLPNDPVIPQ